MLTQNKEKCIRNGRNYGYAECCIDSFLQEEHGLGNEGMFQGTKKEGFIPCNDCYKQIVDIYHEKYENEMSYGTFTIKHAWRHYIKD